MIEAHGCQHRRAPRPRAAGRPRSGAAHSPICRARRMSVPQSKSTHTMLIPCAELERTRRTPAAPFTAVSTGNVTRLSTSSGASPCASVSTVTVGAVRSGKTSTGKRRGCPTPARQQHRGRGARPRRTGASSEARTSRSRTPVRLVGAARSAPSGALTMRSPARFTPTPLNVGARGRRSRGRRAKRASPGRRPVVTTCSPLSITRRITITHSPSDGPSSTTRRMKRLPPHLCVHHSQTPSSSSTAATGTATPSTSPRPPTGARWPAFPP